MEGHREWNVASPARRDKSRCDGMRLPRQVIHSYRRPMQISWWLGMTRDIALLGVESAEVMWRRGCKLLRLDSAAWAEFQLMVGEKVEATLELQCRMVTGDLGPTKQAAARAALNHVRRKVRANRARLRK